MFREEWLEKLQKQKAIAVIRAIGITQGINLAQAAAAGGIQFIEITWNSVQPDTLVARLREDLPDCTIGAGTIVNPTQLQSAIASGCQFLFSPHVDVTLIQNACNAQIPIIPGALSPTEIVTAWQAGATAVKVFPIGVMGGAAYLKALRGPLPHIPLIPTGGVTLENAKSLIDAGAIAVGLSSQLFLPGDIEAENWDAIAQRVRWLCQQLRTQHP
ncbi:MAG: bifunctional 4-hydroxy-2-oxoglutarate aldolase/2-dehydro-3-deoxy-phosphogluconate aldolase [Jaaginema sp. PMC 1079.18]|nr:bifunctional 4-hydroxy-2-oxoglutarate aldolase/2-dehydro-3-deoxy-phosphogluconate aldolase [Jaaginema sp. PMC 1080.18]MEC4850523.1 bifunctional 4-hydroxy-2-oxoglutarate aldolase/2-dehydro-3-deoxy-phosphogluconate aldolase [Jaaginema sp. PMC 1079.18]MEC4865779.1 bifunctional 4-hydroxy-2-oxoglutarate aldolase/2-dehydro-3-deoxy-phosphogluconate aldolase [Jaaginema sp. PMC 1078.18]